MNSAPQLRSSPPPDSCVLWKLWFAGPPLVLSTLLGSAQAQCPPAFEGGNFVCSPPGGGGTYKRLVTGDLSGDWNPEVATIRGTRLIVYHGANIYNAGVVAATGAIDLCFAADSDGSGLPGILYTSSAGLSRVTYVTDHYASALVSSSSQWMNACIVRESTGVLGSPTGNGLFGVAADMRSVFRVTTGGFSTASPMFTTTSNIRDIVPLNWDSDNLTEIAVLQDSGVQVREQDGTLRMTYPGTVAGDAIAVVRKKNLTDSLAWITRLGGASKLLVFTLGLPTQGPTAISAQVFGSMSSGDLDADGYDDLVLASSSVDDLTVLYFDPSQATWFSLASTETVDMSVGSGPQASSGQVLCSNFFNEWTPSPTPETDGLPIPGYALVLTESLGLRLLPGPHEVPDPPPLPPLADFNTVEFRSGWAADCNDTTPDDARSHWKMRLGNGWGLTNATHVEMVVRKCNPESTQTDQAVHEHETFVIDDPLDVEDVTPGIPDTLIEFDGAETDPFQQLSDFRYFAEVRPYRVSPTTGQVVKVWRWSVLGMGASCSGCDWMRHLPGAGSPMPAGASTCGVQTPVNCNFVVGALYVPSAIPQSQIPGGPGVIPGDPPN